MDKCCYLLNKMNVKKELQCAGMLILHVDDILVSGDQSDFYKKALQQMGCFVQELPHQVLWRSCDDERRWKD